MPGTGLSTDSSHHDAPAKSVLRRAIESHSRKVDLEKLARTRKVAHVVSIKVLEHIMMEAVENVLLDGKADPLLEYDRLRAQTHEEFQRLLDLHRKSASGMDEAARKRQRLERQVEALKKELDAETARLETHRQLRSTELQLSPAGLGEFETHLRKVLQELGGDGGVPLPSDASWKVLENDLVSSFSTLVEQERARALAQNDAAHAEEIQRLEQRLAKLGTALQDSESALRELAQCKDYDPGIASIYRSLQGLDRADPGAARKLELIKVVFVNNLRLRNRAVNAEDVEGIPEEYLLQVPPAGSTDGSASPEAGQESPPAAGTLAFRAPLDLPAEEESAF